MLGSAEVLSVQVKKCILLVHEHFGCNLRNSVLNDLFTHKMLIGNRSFPATVTPYGRRKRYRSNIIGFKAYNTVARSFLYLKVNVLNNFVSNKCENYDKIKLFSTSRPINIPIISAKIIFFLFTFKFSLKI